MAFRSGFAALVGSPSAGKSSLMNAMLGSELSIVSPKPQTTRHKILGILNGADFQLCLLDTPGWLEKASDRLQDALMRTTRFAARQDADLILLVAPPRPAAPETLAILGGLLSGARAPLLLAVSKADLASEAELAAAAASYAPLSPVETHRVSAKTGSGVAALREALVRRLPEGPAYYPDDRLSDRWERFFAAEIVREGIFRLYEQELPHACAVEIEDYRETPKRDHVRAVIYVEREGQKGILIGKNGRALRELQETSGKAIEKLTGRPVELDLWVKVKADWRKDPASLKRFGYIPE